MFPNKQNTRNLALIRYGGIDIISRHWAAQNVWLKLCQLPQTLLFPNWKVLGSAVEVTHIAMNRDMIPAFLNALSSVKNAGLSHHLETFDGCFNIRLVRGAHDLSAHSYGLAIDLNAAKNPLGATSGGFYDLPEFVKCFKDQGFDWGGDFSGRKDPMHFSYCWEGPQPAVALP